MNSPRNFFTRLRRYLFSARSVPREFNDNFIYPGDNNVSLRDRPQANFRSIIDQSLEAWRCDPLARRIVSLTSMRRGRVLTSSVTAVR